MRIIVTAQAGAHQGYDLDCAAAYLEAMEQLRADPSAKMERIEAALRLLGNPMPTGGTAVVALFPEVQPLTLEDVVARVYRPGSPWGQGRRP